MSVIELRCPNCGSPSISKNGQEYHCANCQRTFLVVTKPVKENNSLPPPPIKFGKVNFKVNDAKQIGKFLLDQKVNVTYLFHQVFRYRAYRRIVRGSKPVVANEFGFTFVNPFTGVVDFFLNKTNQLPGIEDFKQPIHQEIMRVITSPLFDDKPIGPMHIADVLPLKTTQSGALNWLTHNLKVKKVYIQSKAIQKKGGDLGLRDIEIKFKKNDFQEFAYIGTFAIPIFSLNYRLSTSQNSFPRTVGGYSGLVLKDGLRCGKTKLLGKACDAFPDAVCSKCNSLICTEHEKQCEKCDVALCDDCAISKGIISKHYFCQKCA